MAIEGGALFNSGYVGQGFNWWIGQIADDSYWRDNISSGKFEDKESVPGWGYRYKVRIFGLHDWGEDSIKSENLPWANIMYPVTAGGYQTNSGETPNIRQGNIVFGFFLDGSEKDQPIIMGVMGNNAQSQLATTIGDNRVSNTQPGSVATSGFATGNKDYKGTTQPIVPDQDKGVNRPIKKELASELSANITGKVNEFGLNPSKKITEFQQKDINSAKAEIELILEQNPAFSKEAQNNLITKRVSAGMNARKKEAQSPRSPVQAGATIESEVVHIQSASDIKLDELGGIKRVVLKPDDLVESCNRAMQTDMDNMTQNIDKAMNALSSYTDAVSITEGVRNLKKLISDSSKTQSKYMKVIMDNVMEYSQKKINKEMTSAVSALPSCKRWQMADLKDQMTQNILSEFNDMTGGMSGLMEGVLNNMLKLNDTDEGPGLLTQALNSAFSDTSTGDEKPKSMPRVPICASEDAIAAVLHANQANIEETNNNVLDGIDTFLGDMMKELAGSGGDIGGITSMFSKLGNIRGNMTSALDFKNIKMNVFPFELPPNEAVADYYTFYGGGASQSQTQLPSNSAIMDAVTTLKDRVLPDPEPLLAFAEPPKNARNVDLTETPIGQSNDDFDIDAEVSDNAAQESDFNIY